MANKLSNKKESLKELIFNSFQFSVQSAVEHSGGATTSVSYCQCWSSLVVNGCVDIVRNTCYSVDLGKDKIAFLKAVDRRESHAYSLVDGVVAGVSRACPRNQVEHPPVKDIATAVRNADFIGRNGSSSE